MTDIEALQGEILLVSGTTSGDSDPTAAVKRRKRDSDKAEGNDDESLKEKIVTIWQDVEDSTHLEKAIVATKEIVTEQVQGLIRMGLDAYQRAEHLATKVQLMTDELKQKDVEIGRLRSAEEKNTTSITNLAHALDQSRSQTQDAAHAILVEARLRAEVSTMMAQRDEAIGQAEENKHKVALLKEQIQAEKVKLSRVTREKLTLEREFKVSQRTTETLVQSMENQSSSGSNDTEYYKRKVSELTGRLQSTNAVVAEKSRQIEEMRHQLERNMSQSRWASMSANNHSSSSDGGNKST